MKFKDLNTGNILETENDDVIAQYQKYTDRYEQYEGGFDDDKPFKCPHCEAAYKEQGYLDSHIAKKHPEM